LAWNSRRSPSSPPSLHQFVLPDFLATMRVLTPVGRIHQFADVVVRSPRQPRHPASRARPVQFGACLTPVVHDVLSAILHRQVSLFISLELPTIPSSTTFLPFHHDRFHPLLTVVIFCVYPPGRHRVSKGFPSRSRGFAVASQLPDRLGRIRFTCVADWSFSSGCSPPFLAKDAVTTVGFGLVTLARKGLAPFCSNAFTGALAQVREFGVILRNSWFPTARKFNVDGASMVGTRCSEDLLR
jgi:hypothetical protein